MLIAADGVGTWIFSGEKKGFPSSSTASQALSQVESCEGWHGKWVFIWRS